MSDNYNVQTKWDGEVITTIISTEKIRLHNRKLANLIKVIYIDI